MGCNCPLCPPYHTVPPTGNSNTDTVGFELPDMRKYGWTETGHEADRLERDELGERYPT